MWTELVKPSGETRLCDIDCDEILSASASILSVTSIAQDTNAGSPLTFGTPQVNAAAITYPDLRTVAAGRVIQVLIGGGSIPTGDENRYTIRARFSTSNPGELLEAVVCLVIRDAC